MDIDVLALQVARAGRRNEFREILRQFMAAADDARPYRVVATPDNRFIIAANTSVDAIMLETQLVFDNREQAEDGAFTCNANYIYDKAQREPRELVLQLLTDFATRKTSWLSRLLFGRRQEENFIRVLAFTLLPFEVAQKFNNQGVK